MIEKRLVQWYAADAGVDLDIAEREIVLTYVLRILSDEGLLSHLAFKGGTAMRKLYLGRTGRFSLDLDLTAVGDVAPDTMVLDLERAYAFLRELTIEEARLAADPYGRERQVYRRLVDSLGNEQEPGVSRQ